MAYIITEPCLNVTDKACVDVCPVDCIHEAPEGEKFLYIHPEDCVDCGLCVPECPVDAIFALDQVPDKWKSYIKKNYDLAGVAYSG